MDSRLVYQYPGKSKNHARKEYESFVKEGFAQGRRQELTGGGLIRPGKTSNQVLVR